MANCPQCGAPIENTATECPFCGEPVTPTAKAQPVQQPNPYVPPQHPYTSGGIDINWPLKNKVVAGLLAIFFGGIGIDKFYLGKIAQGVLCILFCWTGLPSLIAFIQGILYLLTDDYTFQIKHHVRLITNQNRPL